LRHSQVIHSPRQRLLALPLGHSVIAVPQVSPAAGIGLRRIQLSEYPVTDLDLIGRICSDAYPHLFSHHHAAVMAAVQPNEIVR